jgi:hypothetical protein
MKQYVKIKLGSGWEPVFLSNVRSAEADGYIAGTVYVATDKYLPEISSDEVMSIVAGSKVVGYSNQGDSIYEIDNQTASSLAALNDERVNAKKAQADGEYELALARANDPAWRSEQVERRRRAAEYDLGMNEGGEGYNPHRD